MQKLKKHLFVALLLFVSTVSFAQYKVTFLVKQPSLLHSMDHLFVAGNFNMWNPGDSSYQLKPDASGISKITLSLPAGNYEYKFTRGNWQKGETDTAGRGTANRNLRLNSDTMIHIDILGWADDFKSNQVAAERNHSASKNVKIMDTAFFIPQLGSQIYTTSGMRTRLHLLATEKGVYDGFNTQFNGDGFSDMHFAVHVVEASEMQHWIEDVKKSSNALTDTAYNQLLKPSIGDKPMLFGNIIPGLFDNVIHVYMSSTGPIHPRQNQLLLQSNPP